MDAILVKIFATGLALSQVTTTPDAVKTKFKTVHFGLRPSIGEELTHFVLAVPR